MHKLTTLSDDAKLFGSTMFGMMIPGEGTLTFKMIDSAPSPRSQRALDELVMAGVVSAQPFNSQGGVVYTPLIEFPRIRNTPRGAWPITVPIGRRALAEHGEG